MLKQTDRIALIMSYVILVACVFSIGWMRRTRLGRGMGFRHGGAPRSRLRRNL